MANVLRFSTSTRLQQNSGQLLCNTGQTHRNNRPMNNNTPDMIDMVFDLDGGILPAAYPFALWQALIYRVPQLAEEISIGVLPLRGTDNKEGLLLPKRAKMVMRLPTTLAEHTAADRKSTRLNSSH